MERLADSYPPVLFLSPPRRTPDACSGATALPAFSSPVFPSPFPSGLLLNCSTSPPIRRSTLQPRTTQGKIPGYATGPWDLKWRGDSTRMHSSVEHHCREGAGDNATSSGGCAGSDATVVASSSTSGKARGRIPWAMAGKASTTAPATSRMAQRSPEKLVELLHEAT
uniref:Uncharacterized protein n=1 Tax=Oryza nivara TaxID=4536 RepID=A0A0E0GPB1_ORYNI